MGTEGFALEIGRLKRAECPLNAIARLGCARELEPRRVTQEASLGRRIKNAQTRARHNDEEREKDKKMRNARQNQNNDGERRYMNGVGPP